MNSPPTAAARGARAGHDVLRRHGIPVCLLKRCDHQPLRRPDGASGQRAAGRDKGGRDKGCV
eukprot:4072544-Prymnesium_polylepis.2